ncbi:MAG TPA: ATP-binding protein, partial [Sulfuricurvum sp.]|nr:ATP-binding protein [Sulfuricurvum sp.]
YIHITTPLVGPHAMLSRNASENDRMLAAKLVLAYCKAGFEGEQTLMFDDVELTTVSDMSRHDAQKYFI